MARKIPLTVEDHILLQYDSYIREIDNSGVPLWVHHAYYSGYPELQGDFETRENDDFPFIDDSDE